MRRDVSWTSTCGGRTPNWRSVIPRQRRRKRRPRAAGGGPKLGVVAREVTLLPRPLGLLAAPPGGASVACAGWWRRPAAPTRRASRHGRQEIAYRFMSAMAGDLPGFEEASRALFAGDRPA